MKKLLGILGLAIVGLFSLASCKKSQDLTTIRRDKISDTYKAKYNLTFDETTGSKKLYNKERSAKATSYYDVYIAEDYTSSLLRYTINIEDLKKDIDDDITKRKLKSIPVNSLLFASGLYADEQTAFIKEIYNSSYGITSKTKNEDKTYTLNYDFGFTVDSNVSWNRTVDAKYLTEAYIDGKTNLSLQVIYLPVYLVRTYKSNQIAKFYTLLPINEAIVCEGKKVVAPTEKGTKYSLEDYTISAKDVDFTFTEEGLLIPSEEYEPKESTTTTTTTTTK